MNETTRDRLQVLGDFVNLCCDVSPGVGPRDQDVRGLYIQRIVAEAIAPLEGGQELDENWQETIRRIMVRVGDDLLKPADVKPEIPDEDPWLRPCPSCRRKETRRAGVNTCDGCGRRWRET